MHQDWNLFKNNLFNRIGEFAKLNPDAMRSITALANAPTKTGKLDAKTHELIALAVAVTTRCDGCIADHSKRALESGATKEEIAEALTVAIGLNAGVALVYTARVFDAIAGQEPK